MDLRRETRYAFRQIRTHPGFAAVAILTMALGLGATAAMFSLIDGILLRPLQYKDPQNLYIATELFPRTAQAAREVPVNARHFHEWRTRCSACASAAMADGFGFTLNGERESVRVPGLRVSTNFFSTLGVQPALGRDFLPEEELSGPHHVILLSDSLWRARYNADPAVVGREIRVDGEAYTIIGVMPASLSLPRGNQWTPGFPHDAQPVMFRPLGFSVASAEGAGMHNYASVIRLNPEVSMERARAEIDSLIQPFAREFNFPVNARLTPMHEAVTSQGRSALWMLAGIVAAVLLVVCVNTGNLMLVRTASRAREAGIRLALGAARRQVFALVFTEAFLLTAMGALLGWFVAASAVSALVASAPAGIPRIEEVRMDWRVLLFALGAVSFSTFVCGLLPALQLARTEPRESFQSGSRSAGDSKNRLRAREFLIGAEVALSTVLLVFGGLLALSFLKLIQVDKGFETEHVLTQDIALTSPEYRQPLASRNYVSMVLPKLAAIPGVRSAGVTSHMPLRGETWTDSLTDAATPRKPYDQESSANFRFVSRGFFESMGIPLKRGRSFEARDSGRFVGILSEEAAARLWPNEDPIGRHVRATGPARPADGLEVIGVAGSVRTGLDQEPPLTVYQPSWTMDSRAWSFVIRTQNDPVSAMTAVREVLRAQDPTVPLSPARTMQAVVDESVAVRRFQMYLVAGFAIAALLLASLGIFGVVSFVVASRTREIGVRLALGAQSGSVMRMTIAQGIRPVIFGLMMGVPAALVLARFIASQLFQISPRDPQILVTVTAMLMLSGALACWLPARRASKIDPMAALRAD